MSDTPPRRLRPETAISDAVVDPAPPGLPPSRGPLAGATVRLEALDPAKHAADLYDASHRDEAARAVWRWLWHGPFEDPTQFTGWVRECAAASDTVFYAVVDATGRACGMTSFLRLAPRDGALEMGHIWFAAALQRTRGSTEALWLMLRHAFDDLGCRRVEWKCNALNGPSRAAALRLGFRFEGIFFRHMIVKGRNRDTAWYSLLSEEWPARRTAFEAWLDPGNFDEDGRQRRPLTRSADDDAVRLSS